jgi:membrane fusion protein (multidrug efflux system)
VGGNIVVVTSQQSGRVLSYAVDDSFYVNEGELLLELDTTDYVLSFKQAKSALALAARQVRSLYEDVEQQKFNLKLQEAKLQKASLDVANRVDLISSDAIPMEEYQHAQSELKVNEAAVNLAKHQLQAAEAAMGVQDLFTHPDIMRARSQAQEAYLAVQRCRILAPVSGYVAKRTAQVGQMVSPTTSLMAIIPLDSLWVDANFKETQLQHVRIDQPVHLTADIYGPEIVFQGRVVGIIPGSGSVFSLLPAQNASGNWIKIVQRIPVRIALDPKEVQKHPLVLGLSMWAGIDTSDRSGPMLAQVPESLSRATTIFDVPMDALNSDLDRIINENLGIHRP